jgi:integration host factor subunit beta
MDRRDIGEKIARDTGLPQRLVHQIVEGTLDEITTAVKRDGRIELRGFATFEVIQRKPRMARNPRTGERVSVPARKVVRFRPGKGMRDL